MILLYRIEGIYMKSIEELTKIVQEFCEARDWDQYHNPKDLAIGLSTESNELLDIFRFKSEEQMKQILNSNKKEHVEEEIADIFFFVLRFAQMNHIQLDEILLKKIEKNNKKYPVDKVKGRNEKYNEL